MSRKKTVPPHKQFAIIRCFREGLSPSLIAREVNERFPEEHESDRLTWHDAKKVIEERAAAGELIFSPRRSEQAVDDISSLYRFSPAMIDVTESQDCLETVAYQTALGILQLILKMDLRSKKKSRQWKRAVHIAFGSGASCRLVAWHLSRMLMLAEPLPPIVLHALTGGFDVEKPFNAANASFSYFLDLGKHVKVDFVGFFAPPLVGFDEAREVRKRPIVRDAFAAASKIDVVVTGLASYDDPHGELKRLVRIGALDAEQLEAAGIVGDVQYCAFNKDGPLELRHGERPLTLFELDELREFAATPGKHVWLVAGPCGACRKPRTAALQALLSEPSLRVWTKIVTDVGTCRELLRLGVPVESEKTDEAAPAAEPGSAVETKKLAKTVKAKKRAKSVKPPTNPKRKRALVD